MSNFKRVQKYRWHDIIMNQDSAMPWAYQKGHLSGPTTIPAKPARQSIQINGPFTPGVPEVYKIKIGGTWAADDTLKISLDGTDWKTFTAKANPTIASMQFSANGSGSVIVQDIIAYIGTTNQPTNWTVTGSDDEIILTYNSVTSGKYASITVSSTAGTAVLSNTQNYSSGDSITISGTTYTCKVGASTASGTTEFEPTATNEDIVNIIVADPLTISDLTISGVGNKVMIAQTVANTGTLLTSSDVVCSSNTGSVTLAVDQEYTAPVSSSDAKYELVPGDLVVVDTTKGNGGYDADGIPYVKPLNVSDYVYGTTELAGFILDFLTIEKGETDNVSICTNGVFLVRERIPNIDIFGNHIDYDYKANSLGKAMHAKNFFFGHLATGGHY